MYWAKCEQKKVEEKGTSRLRTEEGASTAHSPSYVQVVLLVSEANERALAGYKGAKGTRMLTRPPELRGQRERRHRAIDEQRQRALDTQRTERTHVVPEHDRDDHVDDSERKSFEPCEPVESARSSTNDDKSAHSWTCRRRSPS